MKRDRPATPSRFRALRPWWVGGLIFVGGWIGIVTLLAGYWHVSARPALDFLVLLAATNFLFYVWLRACSDLRWDRQIVAIFGVVAAQAGLHQAVRLDGFAGDGRPVWVWRWTPMPPTDEEWKRRRMAQQPPSSAMRSEVNLSQTTSFDSPAFRGADRTGRVAMQSFSSDWTSNTPRLLWKQSIGAGWSSFAVVGDYCVTQEQRGEQEATVCYELRTGRERWAHEERTRFYEPTSGEGPRATPAIHNGRVYSLGATGILLCLDGATGKPIWKVDILTDNETTNLLFGVTGSPLIAGNTVIVNPGGKGSSLAAYDLESGQRIWRAGTSGASYSSPHSAQICGEDQVLDFNAEGLFAHDLLTGEVRWSVPWISNPSERNNVGQPIVFASKRPDEPTSVFIASGYGVGCGLLDVAKTSDGYHVTERWHERHLKAKFSSVVVHDGHAYGFDDAILTCVHVATGKRCWKAGRYGYGQLILVGSNLLIQAEAGDVALVEAAPVAYRELTRFPALAARTWNHPVVAGRLLVVRNDREAACYELPASR